MRKTVVLTNILASIAVIVFASHHDAARVVVLPTKVSMEWAGVEASDGYTQLWIIYSADGSGLE